MQNKQFSTEEITRYSRHILLDEIGLAGQKTLQASNILIVGIGGLGNPAAQYLAAAGVGTIGLMDHDRVDLSNLQRQTLFDTSQLDQPKVIAAKEALEKNNPHINYIVHPEPFGPDSSASLLLEYDLILDCTDNLNTRYLLNDLCMAYKVPLIHGSIYRFEGQVSTFNLKGGPCYRCLYPNPVPADKVPSCGATGVLGVLPGVIGTIQATEALKILLNLGQNLSGRLLVYDALGMEFRNFALPKSSECPGCSASPRPWQAAQETCQTPITRQRGIDVGDLSDEQWQSADLIDIREEGERSIVAIPESRHIPMAKLLKDPQQIHKDRPTILYCKSGARSRRAAVSLQEEGFANVLSLNGGVLAWRSIQRSDAPYY